MTTPLTATAARPTVEVPVGTDPVSLAVLVAAYQGLLNRSEWASKSLLDVKSALSAAADDDFANTSFANVNDGLLTFTNVSVGDKILLSMSGTFELAGALTADGSDPTIELRWLIGGVTDASVSGAGAYPNLAWGSTQGASATDGRAISFMNVHTAAGAAASLTAQLQNKCAAGHTITSSYRQCIGLHIRLGAT